MLCLLCGFLCHFPDEGVRNAKLFCLALLDPKKNGKYQGTYFPLTQETGQLLVFQKTNVFCCSGHRKKECAKGLGFLLNVFKDLLKA